MSKKKHPEHVNHERWLVSYADFITLLFAFFVVLFASGQSDKKKQTQMAAAMQSAFSPMSAFEAHAKTPPLDPHSGSGSNATPAPIQPAMPTAEQVEAQEAARITERLKAQIAAEAALESVLPASAHPSKAKNGTAAPPALPADSISIHRSPEGLVISLHEAGFFASGSADVRPASIELIQRIAATLPQGPIRIEGHTDNVPIHTAQFATNWELSTARAARIARVFLDVPGAVPANISAAGYAEYHPLAANDTEAGRAQNRRIDVILLHAPTSPAPPMQPATPSHPVPSR